MVSCSQTAPKPTTKYLIPQGTVALWDFQQSDNYLVDVVSGHKLTSHNVKKKGDKGLYFNGKDAYLEIIHSKVGNLDVAKYGEEITILAMINPVTIGTDYIAGMWQENNHDPQREYGLFIDLPKYGGPRKVIGHVSRWGGASPGLPFSRDYAASGRSVVPGKDSFIGMTYDGHVAKSYLDGLTDSYINYQESDSIQLYDKNPYTFNLGLNKTSVANFNVGANLLTHGMANFYHGYISKLIVIARALSEKEMADMAYYYCKKPAFATFPNIESANDTIEATQGGFKTRTYVGSQICDNISSGNSVKNVKSTTESSLYIAPSDETTALAYIESEFLYLSQVSSFSFKAKSSGDQVGGARICIKVGDHWYASKNVTPPPSYAENQMKVDFSVNDWMDFDYNNLRVSSAPSNEIENKRINAIGILFVSVGNGSSVNVSDIEVNI